MLNENQFFSFLQKTRTLDVPFSRKIFKIRPLFLVKKNSTGCLESVRLLHYIGVIFCRHNLRCTLCAYKTTLYLSGQVHHRTCSQNQSFWNSQQPEKFISLYLSTGKSLLKTLFRCLSPVANNTRTRQQSYIIIIMYDQLAVLVRAPFFTFAVKDSSLLKPCYIVFLRSLKLTYHR